MKRANVDRYLIVNYEHSNFSVSQNSWEPNAPSQIISLPAKSNATTSKITITTTPSHKISTGAIIGIIIAVVVLIIASAIAIFFFFKRRSNRKNIGKDGTDGDEMDPSHKAEMDATPAGKGPFDDSPYNHKFGEEMEGSKPDLGADMRKGSEMEGSNPDLAAKLKSEMEGDAGAIRAEVPGSGGVLRAEAPGSEGAFRAEAEGSRGGWEMDGAQGTLRAEMPVPTFAPVELYAGEHGLSEMPSPVSGSDHPSPISSPHSPERRPGATSWSRRQADFPRSPRSGSDISSPDEEVSGRSRVSPQSQSRERHGSAGGVAGGSASRRTTPTDLSPSDESDPGGWRRGYGGNLSPQSHTGRELPSRTGRGGGGREGRRRLGSNPPNTPGTPSPNEGASNGGWSSGAPGGYF